MAPKRVVDDPFADFEELAAQASKRRAQCGVDRLLTLLESESAIEELGGELAPPLRRALANTNLTSTAIRVTLQNKLGPSWEIPLTESFQRHRRRHCTCGRD